MRRLCIASRVLSLVVVLAAFGGPLLADVKLPAVIGDHMVVQQGLPVPVWGTADAGEQVTVSMGDQKKTATAGADGKWMVRLEAMKASKTPRRMTVTGKNTIAIEDVLVGEVWVCSGQSNMEWPVSRSRNAEQEIQSADFPLIRLFTVPKTVAAEPQTDTKGKWGACTQQSVPGFSAVGYYFGRDLHKEIDVPVGLVHTAWGGTPAESWTEISVLKKTPDFQPIVERHEQATKNYPQEVEKWTQAAEKAREEGKKAPNKPGDPATSPWRPAGLYNGMITPVAPFAIRGAIWYQGESNAGRAYQYRKLLPAMIQSWRDAWGQDDFAFLIVSLANFTPVKDQPGDSDWAELREAQAMTAAMPHNGLAITIDVGDANDIHPTDKQSVGHRLMLQALQVAYGRSDVAAAGPALAKMTVEGRSVRLKFKNAYDGLAVKGDELKGFAVAGEDRKFHWAKAVVKGDEVVVQCDEVAEPKAVRYAWANNPVCNLYNGAGLPAAPFRTDDWPGITVNNR